VVGRIQDEARFNTNRLAACARVSGMSICREQRVTDNILVQEIGVGRWNDFILHFLDNNPPIVEGNDPMVRLLASNQFLYRGDTLFVLAEIVHDSMLRLLNGCHEYSIAVAEATDQYPILTKQHLDRYEKRELHWLYLLRPFYSNPGWYELRTGQLDEAVSAFLLFLMKIISEGKTSSADCCLGALFYALVSVV
jgi:hypothetical protein